MHANSIHNVAIAKSDTRHNLTLELWQELYNIARAKYLYRGSQNQVKRGLLSPKPLKSTVADILFYWDERI
jgi:hypothetical protein